MQVRKLFSQIGWSGQRRIFAYYRDALLLLLPPESAERAEMLVRVSFRLLAAAMVGKACANDQTLTDLSRNVLAEISTAAIAYLEARRGFESKVLTATFRLCGAAQMAGKIKMANNRSSTTEG